jgi:transposase
MTWTGYKMHLTETCDADALHVITHVETTAAAVSDVAMTEPMHQALAAHQRTPDDHVVDAGSVDAELTAAAITIDRLAAWLDSRPHAKPRRSRFAALAR